MTSTHRSPNGILLSLLLISLVLLLLVSAKAGGSEERRVMHFDGPVYASVEDLGRNADVVVLGTVLGQRESVVDFGSDGRDEGGGGLPLSLLNIEVSETVTGDKTADNIVMAVLDPQLTVSESTVRLDPGDKVLLYLVQRRVIDSQAIKLGDGQEFFYIPLSFNNGIMRVEAGAAVTTGEFPYALSSKDASNIAEEQGERERDGTPLIPTTGSRFDLESTKDASRR